MKKIITQNYRGNNVSTSGDLPSLSSQLINHVHAGLSFPITLNEESEETVDLGILVKKGIATPFLFTSNDVDAHFTNLGDIDFHTPSDISASVMDELKKEVNTAFDVCKKQTCIAKSISDYDDNDKGIPILQVGVTLHIGNT